MRFARQLAAVLLLVGAIVALGLAWGHASGAGQSFPGRVMFGGGGGGPGFSLSNSGNPIRTVEIEILIMTVVITISAVRLPRRRHARRTPPSP